MAKLFARFPARSERGASATEFGVMLGVTALLVLALVALLGGRLTTAF